MLMSKSRLEKFLYALYSLDSSDLPNPISRIEELYKCWVTGEEAPTFEPLSRVEKYLMAILGVYDADSLPNPLSRVEVLLYKLATGDDNLDDIKSFLSEHEELLAEIIRNGGVGGNIDIEYVLYTLSTEFNTLYNTAKKPVKSAILKGQTLVNICKPYEFDIQTTGSGIRHIYDKKYVFNIPIQDDKQYSIWIEIDINEIGAFSLSHTGAGATLVFDSVVGLTLTHGSTIIYPCVKRSNSTNVNFSIGALAGSTEGRLKGRIMVFEGDIRGFELSYFTGMQSVKMPVLTTTGKNLFDGKLEKGIIDATNGRPISIDNYVRTVNFIKVQPNMVYTISEKNDSTKFKVYEYDENFNYLGELSTETFTTKSNTSHIKFRTYPKNTGDDVSRLDFKVMLETGDTAAPYEPYKSNILTVNEEIELRGIGDVQDTLDLVTGELTEHIGVAVLDGSEDEGWYTDGTTDLNARFKSKIIGNIGSTETIADKITSYSLWESYNDANGNEALYLDTVNGLHLSILKTKVKTVDELKLYLQSNPIRIQYQLATESIKTVDLSVVDQDGNNTKLSTFNDITYVTLSSEGLIPEAELEVATKNKEDLEDSVVYAVHTLSEELNTLYNTAEKPIKSAILKGQTLVNVHPTNYIVAGSNPTFFSSKIIPKTMIKPNTRYFLRLYNTHQSVVSAYFKPCVKNRVDLISSDNKCAIFTTKSEFTDSDFSNNKIHFYSSSNLTLEDVKDTKVILCEYVDGMENWDIPYFEGMQSVKMPVLTTSNEDDTKSNILTVNEEVELRGIGDVKDELNLITGELTQRIGEVVLDGSENWVNNGNSNDYIAFRLELSDFKKSSKIVSDSIPVITTVNSGFGMYSGKGITVTMLKTVTSDLSNFKTWLSTNPVTIQYQLAESNVKTVDLSTVNQDGNDAKLSTFDDLTHVTLSSEGLIPEAELEVAEKVTEVASSMLTISREQEVIDTTTNEQSENVDATMIATTEIYEDLL